VEGVPDDDDLPEHLRPVVGEGTSERARRAIGKVTGGTLDKLSTGRLGRAAKLGKLAWAGGRAVLGDKVRSAMGGNTTGSGQALATEMLQTFSEMRGISMKLGQMLSYLDDGLPPEAQRVLAVLQRDVQPMPWPKMQPVLEEGLGRPYEEIFAEVDATPIAAASIGQVHRGRLHDGTAVAVKLQYPGMAEAMKADLKNAKVLNIIQKGLSFSTDTAAITAELEQRFLDECDYEKEAAYQNAYQRRFAGHPTIVVPDVFEELSSGRVLVTRFERGRGYYEWLADASPTAREHAARTFYRFYLGAFYLDGLFNCDPHPGNYLFRDDGKIVFLDYGCCRRFEPPRLEQWIAFCKVICQDDEDGIDRTGRELGFVKGPGTYDREAFHDLIRYLYTPYLADAPFRFRDYRPQETFRRMFTENKNLFKLDMPPDTVFLNRINFGLVSLLAEMDAVINVRSTVDAYFEGIDPDWPEDPFRGQRYAA
jgi:predicted unusual protein kinase regulating ubiquinone biosynthesis (AarF/ABC1/UbiB family)